MVMDMMGLLSVFIAGFIGTYLATPKIARKLSDAGHVVQDMNKQDNPEVPEMGGIAIVAGFTFAVIVAIALSSNGLLSFELVNVLAGLSVVLIIAHIGVIDDLVFVSQHKKAILPLFASLPLVALKVGVTSMWFPLIGRVELGWIYAFVIVPLAITGASNAMNMLAGFNGLEAGLGVVMTGAIAAASWLTGGKEALILSVAMLGALLGFLRFNWNPARILIGDVGTLSIGAVVASSVIIGNIERVGVILIIPFFLELYLKAKSRFKAQSFCDIRGELLVCPDKGEIYGIGRLLMHLSKGITETRLVLTILVVELVFAIVAVWSVM